MEKRDRMNITERLFELQDQKYGDFQSKLSPNLKRETIIGVRVPELRKLAKEIRKEGAEKEFLEKLPHDYFEENILHGAILCEEKDYELCMDYVEKFLPYVDNWAVCDTMSPKVFKKHKKELLVKIREWAESKETYTCRFGIGQLMAYYLDKDFQEEYLEIPAAVHSEEYYVNMMLAWFYATALAKQWDWTIVYLEERRLDKWVHNKTIQKARESLRITAEQKEYLKTLK